MSYYFTNKKMQFLCVYKWLLKITTTASTKAYSTVRTGYETSQNTKEHVLKVKMQKAVI